MRVAAIYARKSTDQNGVADEAKSVARQVEHAKNYATRKGWTVADEHVYIDNAWIDQLPGPSSDRGRGRRG